MDNCMDKWMNGCMISLYKDKYHKVKKQMLKINTNLSLKSFTSSVIGGRQLVLYTYRCSPVFTDRESQ